MDSIDGVHRLFRGSGAVSAFTTDGKWLFLIVCKLTYLYMCIALTVD